MPDGNGGNLIYYVFLALWGGATAYLTKIRAKGRPFKIVEFVVQLLTSGFAGLMAAYMSVGFDLGPGLTGLVAGMSGYMGAAAVKLLEQYVTGFLSGWRK